MEVGDVILEKYRIDRVLGAGGMGVVVAATDLFAARTVALKLLKEDKRQDPEAIARLVREAEAASKLSGRHTGRVLDVERLPNGQPILVLELLEGEDLAHLLARDGALPAAAAVAMVLEACEGLAEAHAARLVHRDIKPSNLFRACELDGTHAIKVIDFGVVKSELGDQAALTRTTSTIGSVAYMSPEQLRKRPLDARTDIWSLGVVLYELVAAKSPFPADTVTDASIRIAVEPPDPLPASVPTELASVILRCLEKESDRRYGDVAELARALAPFTASGEASAERIARVLGTATQPANQDHKLLASPAGRSVRLRDYIATHWLLLGLVLFVLALVLLLGSFADDANELEYNGRRVGYTSSFNWTIVHTFLSPIAIGIVGILLAATNNATAAFGRTVRRAWDARARNVIVLWIILSLALAVGYTVVEWSYVFFGDCKVKAGGVYLGWPNKLCDRGRDISDVLFMVFGAVAQAAVLTTSWLMFSTVFWMHDLFFGRRAVKLAEHHYTRVGQLFAIAAWGWATLFIAVYLARLWSFHLQLPSTSGVLDTIFDGFPGSLFDINAHSQPDVGSMIGGAVMLVGAVLPFALLRARIQSPQVRASLATLQRASAVFGIVALLAMFFPRIGFFMLPAVVILAIAVRSWRRTLLGAWTGPRT